MDTKTFLFGDRRALLPTNKPISGTVPIQHENSVGSEPLRKLPIARKCIGYIADTINKAEPQIVDLDGNVLATRHRLPEWIRQPTPEYVMEETIQQSVWSLFVNGYLRMLGFVGPTGRPAWIYIGVSPIQSMVMETGQILYVYTPDFGEIDDLVANRVAYRRRFSAPGPVRGIGEMEPARTLLNTALHAQDVVDRYFGSNMMMDLIFTHDGEYIEGAGSNLLEQLAKRHAGPSRAWRPLVQDRKWKVERLRESNQASQMIELWGMVNTMVCTQVFGIDPLVFSLSSAPTSATSLTYQNASNLRSQVWQQAVEPIANIIAGAYSEYLPSGQMLQFSPTEFLRGSPSDRGQLVAQMALANKHSESEIFTESEMRDVLGYSPKPKSPREVE